MTLLEKGLGALNIQATDRQKKQLDLYLAEIELWNPKYNLVKVSSSEEIVTRHLLDSLAGLEMIKKAGPECLADLGSGGGFPGILLAIFMENCHFSLVERSGRRCSFLENALLQLELKNSEVLHCDLNQVQQPFDLVTFRAFRPFEPDILLGIKKILKPGGSVFAYKGKKDKTEQEWDSLKSQFASGEIIPLKVPFSEGERHMLVMRKG